MGYDNGDRKALNVIQTHTKASLTLFLVLLSFLCFSTCHLSGAMGEIGTKFVLLHSLPQAGLDDLLKRIYEICKSQVNRLSHFLSRFISLLLPLTPHFSFLSPLSEVRRICEMEKGKEW